MATEHPTIEVSLNCAACKNPLQVYSQKQSEEKITLEADPCAHCMGDGAKLILRFNGSNFASEEILL